MRTTSRFARGIAGFRHAPYLVLGLLVGVATSCIADQDPVFDDEHEQDLGSFEAPQAQVALDPILGSNDEPTGSVCSSGPYRCFAHVRSTASGHVRAFAAPNGLGPSDLQSAYNIPTNISGTPTVAIVDAYGYPQLESDLATYRQAYGLPPCTVANGCLKIVNEQGQTSPLPAAPPATDDWTLETALDVDMVSAACPKCKILVVQATDNAGDGLFTAQNAAAQLGATVISNSWGGPEQAGSSLSPYETYFDHPGIAVFVAAGDDGYNDAGQGPDYPGTSAHVIAVGGTRLVRDASTRGWSETAWSMGGSACSLSIPKPAYQSSSPCQYKATTDIAAVGDPQTGLAIYNAANGGWGVIGGTSASAPIIAAIFAATGNGGETSGSFVMQNAGKLYDITSGTNGSCANSLCRAGTGWDGPTGYGTPNAGSLVAGGTGGGDGSGSGSGDGTGGGNGGGDGNGNGVGGGVADNDVYGGCAAGGSGAGLSMVLVVGLALVRRRRRAAR